MRYTFVKYKVIDCTIVILDLTTSFIIFFNSTIYYMARGGRP